MQKHIFFIILCLLTLTAVSQGQKKDTIKLFYLGGQSNMDGYGFNNELPDSLRTTFKNVWIYHGNPAKDEETDGGLGKWDTLKPGHGVLFSSNGKENNLSDRFGVELSFAKRLQELYPNEKIAIIKYSKGGTAIDSIAAKKPYASGSWEPDYKGTNGVNQYDHYLTTIKNALKVRDINSNGIEDELIPSGIIWMQGESDGFYTEDIASRYYANLKRLMDLMRASFHTDNLPVVIGKISDSGANKGEPTWPHGKIIQDAQEAYVRNHTNTAIVRNTSQYQYSDLYHYNSKGFIDLGVQFAEAIYKLNKN